MRSVSLLMLTLMVAVMAAAQAPPPAEPVPPPAGSPPAADSPAAGAQPGSEDAVLAASSDDQWEAFLKRYREVRKYPRDLVVKLSPNLAYPAIFMRHKMEIVDEDAEWVYLRNLPIEDPDSRAHRTWVMRQTIEVRELMRQEAAAEQFVMDPAVEHPLPGFSDRIHLEERSSGLPIQGRWGLGVAVADMNGDGLVDLVLPPVRLGKPYPTVFLQTSTGWQEWTAVQWPEIKLDYGDVQVADFDGDGHLDIALACHFLRNYVLYGNGKGDFTRWTELPRASERITSRALVKADFDGDGRMDLATLAELDVDLATNAQHLGALVQVLLNTPKGWQALEIEGGGRDVYGDHLAVGDFNADGRPDLLVSSHKNSNRHLIFLNRGDGRSFRPVSSREFPYLGYVFGVAAGKLDGTRGDAAVVGAFQSVRAGSQQHPMNGVIVYTLGPGEDEPAVARTVVAVDGREYDAYVSALVADVDGDGRNDLVMGRRNGTVEIYLQGLEGQLVREYSPELDFGDAYINALAVAAPGSGSERMLIVVSSDGKSTAGSVRAFAVRRGPLTRATVAR
ncbi:MAG: VCBS repeat-containing protein [Thermoanaerobaculaceae bacterium]|nr:VCBS repeat-containing protein [Thermoanaerobaculaceae bacterium]MDI9623115.1 VCBS repeat-containing protein [Acidobacteriota bacterium]